MFFRLTKSPSGEVLQLVESYRNEEGKSRQQLVLSLGKAAMPWESRSVISKAVEELLYDEPSLLERPLTAEESYWVDFVVKSVLRDGKWTPRRARKVTARPDADNDHVIDGVLIDDLQHGHHATLGPELLGWTVWNRLGMPQFLESLGFNNAQQAAAAVSVLNRLVDPVSEHFLQTWLPTSALPDLLGQNVLNFADDRYYRVSDQLLSSRDKIETHLRSVQQECFELNRTILLYDLTNTHFEGECRGNPKAKRGKNKQKRNDCPQVAVGMVFDQFGFELAHRTFSGNTRDPATLTEIVETLKKITDRDDRLPCQRKPVVIVDAGIATKDNLRILREHGFSYLVNDSRKQRGAFLEQFRSQSGFTEVQGRFKNDHKRPPVLVKVTEPQIDGATSTDSTDAGHDTTAQPTQDGCRERVLLCKSEARRLKEAAIINNAESRLCSDLEKLSKRVAEGKLKDHKKINQAIGRLRSQNSRVARFYEIQFVPRKQPPSRGQPAGAIRWRRKDQKIAENDDLLGCYVLRTDCQELDSEDMWHLYITLTEAEAGFKALKTDLGLRPNFHQIEPRVDAHIFITVLAYHVLHHILYTLRAAGDHRNWHTLNRVLRSHCYSTVTVPTINNTIYRIRKPGQPEAAHQAIYRHFDIQTQNLSTSKTVIQ